MEEHYYNPAHTGLLELGLEPHPLTDAVVDRLMGEVERWKGDIVHDRIFRGVKWKK
jgi:UDP-sulfoquinovose synthase